MYLPVKNNNSIRLLSRCVKEASTRLDYLLNDSRIELTLKHQFI